MLIEDMDHPENNELKAAHSQIVAAVTRMSDNVNAELKVKQSRYSLNFSKLECGYSFEMTVDFGITGTTGKLEKINFSLLDSSLTKNSIRLSEKSKWNALIKSKSALDGLPLNASERFVAIEAAEIDSCKIEPISPEVSTSLYLTPAEMKQKTLDLVKAGRPLNSSRICAIKNNEQVFFKIKGKSSDVVTCSYRGSSDGSFGTPSFDIQSNRWSCPAWVAGNPSYSIHIEVNGKDHVTNENEALANPCK